MFTDNIADRMALERADLGCCMYTATGGLLQVCAHVSYVDHDSGSQTKSLAMTHRPRPCHFPSQATHAVLGSHGLERLVLYLKVLKESTEIFS